MTLVGSHSMCYWEKSNSNRSCIILYCH